MARLNIPQEMIDNPDDYRLLPVNVEKDGQMMTAEYLGEVTSAKQVVDGNGNPMLRVSVAVTHKGNRLYVNDMFTYSPAFLKRLTSFIKTLGLPTNPVPSEEDFVGRFVWITVKHQAYKSKKETNPDGTSVEVVDNQVANYLRAATVEEVQDAGVAFP